MAGATSAQWKGKEALHTYALLCYLSAVHNEVTISRQLKLLFIKRAESCFCRFSAAFSHLRPTDDC